MGIRWRGKREEVLEIRERREWVKERREEEKKVCAEKEDGQDLRIIEKEVENG